MNNQWSRRLHYKRLSAWQRYTRQAMDILVQSAQMGDRSDEETSTSLIGLYLSALSEGCVWLVRTAASKLLCEIEARGVKLLIAIADAQVGRAASRGRASVGGGERVSSLAQDGDGEVNSI
jgi:hypothetical protein